MKDTAEILYQRDKTTGLTIGATRLLMRELEARRKRGYAVSKTSLASEAIIGYFGNKNGLTATDSSKEQKDGTNRNFRME